MQGTDLRSGADRPTLFSSFWRFRLLAIKGLLLRILIPGNGTGSRFAPAAHRDIQCWDAIRRGNRCTTASGSANRGANMQEPLRRR